MRWLVLGAGALGGYFGGRLAQAGRDVTFLLRPRTLARVRGNGLQIASPLGDVHLAAPPCIDHVEGAYDAVLLGCKAYDLDSALDAIAPAVGPSTAILPMLNGMRHIEALATRFGRAHVLGGVAMISAALDADGTVRHYNKLHRLLCGELDGTRSPRLDAIAADFAGTNTDVRASDAIVQEMWDKWTFIATLAGSQCLLRGAVGDIVKAGALDVVETLLDECIAIAGANGRPPGADAQARMHAFIASPDSTVTASMLKDVERHARCEGEQIVGDLLARAPVGMPTPVLRIVAAHLRTYAARRAREWAVA